MSRSQREKWGRIAANSNSDFSTTVIARRALEFESVFQAEVTTVITLFVLLDDEQPDFFAALFQSETRVSRTARETLQKNSEQIFFIR